MSFPFYNKEFTFTQPDGTKIKVKGWGDQHHALFETPDGYTIVKDPETGFYTYASLAEDGNELKSTGVKVGEERPATVAAKSIRINRDAAKAKALSSSSLVGEKRRCDVRREQAKAAMKSMLSVGGPFAAPPSQGTIGKYVGLCLLIQFPDEAGTITTEQVNDFCNTQGYNGYNNNGSVYDYFYENSEGKLQYTNIITPYYTAQHPKSYYANPQVSYGSRTRELITEALAYFKDNNFDFSQLSADDGGYVYALNVFYAGNCPNNWSEGLWPHSWSLASRYMLETGRYAYDYQITDIGNELSLATFCHENGHMVCDYPDLYDYGYESRGTGVYCLMCAGGHDEKNPTQICAYLKYKAGWTKEVVPTTDQKQVTLVSGKNEVFIYPKNQTEYFMIENRQKSGRDASLPGSGLAIWHVDELGSNNYEQMDKNRHYECSLEQADNKFDLEHGNNYGDSTDLFNAQNNDTFTDSTNPNSKWWDGKESGMSVLEISETGTEMTFKAEPTNGGVTVFSKTSTPQIAIPDNDPAGIADTITFTESATISVIKVSVDITHTYRGDLRVILTSPSGTSVILHNRKGSREDDIKQVFDEISTPQLRNFAGQSIKGNWTIQVQDLARIDTGVLNRWGLEIEGLVDSVVTIEESPGVRIPDNDPNGVVQEVNTDASGVVKDITVGIDITHTYIRDLLVTLTSAKGTSVKLHNRTGGSSDNIVKTYTIATTTDLGQIIGEQIKGTWKLKVADLEGWDRGKLNHWEVKITR
jgi:M6 family metalloprotease-like protein